MDRKFVNFVEKVCVETLVEKGFESPRNGTRFIRLSDSFLGWVGLNKGNHPDFLRVNPFIGIHCIPIMKLTSELAGDKYKEGQFASYAIHMGEIAPGIDQFIFRDETDLEKEANRLADEIENHALPWMNEHANYKSLIPLFETRIDMLGGYPERYASALHFSGKGEEAKKFVEERTDLFDPSDEGTYSLYVKFGKPFLEMLADEGRTE